jgi:hypothetical protein
LRKELYYFRDQQGLEVDFVVPRPNAHLWLVEAKASKTVDARMAAPMLALAGPLGKRVERRIVVHRKARQPMVGKTLTKGAEALTINDFAAQLLAAKGA